MPERETPDKNAAAGGAMPPRTDDRTVAQDPDVGQQPDPDSQQSGPSRPRGHTEEPDRTL
jgi:hypothetical protein